LQSVSSTKTSAVINGVKVEKNTSLYDFSLSFHYGQDLIDENYIFFLIALDYPEAYFEDASVTLKIDDTTYTTENVSLLNKLLNNNNCNEIKNKSTALNIFTSLFSKEATSFSSDSQIEFHGEFILNNGVSLMMDKKGGICDTIITGVSQIFKEPEFDELMIIHHGVNNIGVADFRRVEQELCCYVPGEVSRIENIMAREHKFKQLRSFEKSVTATDFSSEMERENTSEVESSERFEMQNEVSRVVQSDRSSAIGFGVQSGYNSESTGFYVNGDVHGDFAFAKSSSDSNSSAQTYAKDVTRRALERVTQRISIKRSKTITKEFEKNTTHAYDNRKGDKHVSGVYRWVDKVYENRLVNYGKRLLFEFMIPEPAKFYKKAILEELESQEVTSGNTNTENTNTANTNTALKPELPSITIPSDVNEGNYETEAAKYGALSNVTDPLESLISVTGAFSESIGTTNDPKTFTYNDVSIPQDYECVKIEYSGSGYHKNWCGWGSKKAFVKVTTMGTSHNFGNWCDKKGRTRTLAKTLIITSGNSGLITVKVNTRKFDEFSLTAILTCELKDTVYTQWQQDSFDAIMSAYQQKLDEYNAIVTMSQAEVEAVQEETEEKAKTRNTGFNDEIILTELKRLSIEILTKPFDDITQGKNFYATEENWKCKVPHLVDLEKLKDYSSQAKFFEQAFDWELMAKLFYPYYWGNKCQWKELFRSQESNDHIFRKFLQSGLSRIIVPVKQGFENAVTYYMETGDIWNGTEMVINTSDDLYLSINDEISYLEGVVEDQWKTRVPTALSIIQAGNLGLKVDGLPCDVGCNDFRLFDSDGTEILDKNNESFTNPIEKNDDLIGGVNPTV